MPIRNPRDFWAGAIYLALAIAVLWIGRDYSIGSSARMGPGYFPAALGFLLGLFGIASMARAFFRAGEPITPFAWRPLLLVLGSVVLFGVLVNGIGALIALPLMIVVAAMASRYSRLDATSAAALVGIVAFCVLVFVKGLGMPMPLIGAWLGG
jgi:putative tricarboxylic transport membrane protein